MMAQCISPIRLNREGTFHDVPCGRCGFCLQNRRKEWSFRLQKELRRHVTAYFLTLTYAEEHLPWQDLPTEEYPQPVLYKSDFQLFMKRLRKRQSKVSKVKLKYYAVGEYGSKTCRPHYHAILFSLDPILVSELQDIWSLGMVHVGTVTNDSIDYVTKYVINRYDQKRFPVPPFSLISKGVGLEHLEQNLNRYQYENTCINNRGYKQVLPRYYRDKLKKSPFTKEIEKAKSRQEAHERQQEELRRLKKLHPDPQSYYDERRVENNNRILRSASKGDRL